MVTPPKKQTATAPTDAASNELAAFRTALSRFILDRSSDQPLQSIASMMPVPAVQQAELYRRELECARILGKELPEEPIHAVRFLEEAVIHITKTDKNVILFLDDESGTFTCVNDEQLPDVAPREITWISDHFLQELLDSENVIHTVLFDQNRQVGLVAVADKSDGSAFTPEDEWGLEMLAQYLGPKLSAYARQKKAHALPRIQNLLLLVLNHLNAAIDEPDMIRPVLEILSTQLGFGACQYVTLDSESGTGAIEYQYPERMDSEAPTKVEGFASLVSLVTSMSLKRSYFVFNSPYLADRSLSDMFHVPNIQKTVLLPIHDLSTNQVRGVITLFMTESSWIQNETLDALQEIPGTVTMGLNRSRLFEKAMSLAGTDELTGLTNRRGFYTRLRSEIERARRQKSPMCVAIVDVDHFKKLNDTYGHLAGDQILQGLANVFNTNLRKSDLICRFGGEEFVLLLPDTGIEQATKLLNRVRKNIETMTFNAAGYDGVKATISAGLAPVDLTQATEDAGDENSMSVALAAADEALYDAKNNGRNQVRLAN